MGFETDLDILQAIKISIDLVALIAPGTLQISTR